MNIDTEQKLRSMADKQQNPLRFAVIGCGLIGKKRAAHLKAAQLVYACDVDPERATDLGRIYTGCMAVTDYKEILADKSIDAVIVSTLNAALAPISLDAVKAGKHVLIEKPGALRAEQLRQIQSASEKTGTKVRIGYNHRFHPALQKARELIDSGVLGPLMFLRGRYGHGGRKGYDREWRADPKLS
ncbi:MAG TPA: Gfo/Idh/MocA family oxidoreductase, partial [Opitutaceae bacterium]|nr:Gfo/Idh/MocA family oxidoreductase [Opitutaceae bacterium]